MHPYTPNHFWNAVSDLRGKYSGKGIALKRAKYSPPPDGEGVLHLVVGNCINKTKYIKLKGFGDRGLIEESFPAQQFYEFVHGVSIDIKVKSKGESEILFAAFQNGFPN